MDFENVNGGSNESPGGNDGAPPLDTSNMQPSGGNGSSNGDVWSLQQLLRNISSYYDNVTSVIPDGIFGAKTEASVISFQKNFGLEATGVINFETWNRIVAASNHVDRITAPANSAFILSETNDAIYPGDKDVQLYAIQGMMKALSEMADNFRNLEITGIHDFDSVMAVKEIQSISGIEDSGIINTEFCNHLGSLYETFITRNRVSNRA